MEDPKYRTGMRVLHVPYQGSPRAMVGLMAGNVQIGFDTATVTLPQVKAGKLRMIAVGSLARLPEFPGTPTIAELGHPDFEAVAWIGLTAPAGTPRDMRERLHAEINKALRAPDFIEKMRTMGAVPRPMSLDEFAAFMRREQKRWKGIVERTGVKAE